MVTAKLTLLCAPPPTGQPPQARRVRRARRGACRPSPRRRLSERERSRRGKTHDVEKNAGAVTWGNLSREPRPARQSQHRRLHDRHVRCGPGEGVGGTQATLNPQPVRRDDPSRRELYDQGGGGWAKGQCGWESTACGEPKAGVVRAQAERARWRIALVCCWPRPSGPLAPGESDGDNVGRL